MFDQALHVAKNHMMEKWKRVSIQFHSLSSGFESKSLTNTMLGSQVTGTREATRGLGVWVNFCYSCPITIILVQSHSLESNILSRQQLSHWLRGHFQGNKTSELGRSRIMRMMIKVRNFEIPAKYITFLTQEMRPLQPNKTLCLIFLRVCYANVGNSQTLC